MMIGSVGSGKTTLCQALSGGDLQYKKTQQVEVLNKNILDTPGEFLERLDLMPALAVMSSEADVILFLQSATDERNKFSPGYRGAFAAPCIGVITKIDAASEYQIEAARIKLMNTGVSRIFQISSFTGAGIPELLGYIESLPLAKSRRAAQEA